MNKLNELSNQKNRNSQRGGNKWVDTMESDDGIILPENLQACRVVKTSSFIFTKWQYLWIVTMGLNL